MRSWNSRQVRWTEDNGRALMPNDGASLLWNNIPGEPIDSSIDIHLHSILRLHSLQTINAHFSIRTALSFPIILNISLYTSSANSFSHCNSKPCLPQLGKTAKFVEHIAGPHCAIYEKLVASCGSFLAQSLPPKSLLVFRRQWPNERVCQDNILTVI